ncbi:MAG: hypothetical protein HN650_12635 [Rhodospirillaceae bacterium]|nr:hypothetical protein [Rhodospirillaceae bacterium]
MKELSALIIGETPYLSHLRNGQNQVLPMTHMDALCSCSHFTWIGSSSSNLDRVYVNFDENRLNQDAVSPLSNALTDLDLAVILTRPQDRLEIVQQLIGVRCIVIEPPLGLSLTESEAFLAFCASNNIRVVVSSTWRSEPLLQSLAMTGIEERIGKIFGGAGTFGAGLWHSGTLWIDLARHLLGDIEMVQALGDAKHAEDASVRDDQFSPFAQFAPFALTINSSSQARQFVLTSVPQDLCHARSELNLWGEMAGLNLVFNENEIRLLVANADGSIGQPETFATSVTLGAFYNSVAQAIAGVSDVSAATFCEGADMLFAERVVEAILDSADQNGERYYFG